MMGEEQQNLVGPDLNNDHIVNQSTSPVPTVVVEKASDDSHSDLEELENLPHSPLLQKTDINGEVSKTTENGNLPSNNTETTQNHEEDHFENSIPLKSNFKVSSPQSGSLQCRDDPFHSRDMLSSPTASRGTFAFGSIDIIMECDKNKSEASKPPQSDPYERPQKWGWVVVIASWIVMIPIVGVLSSFGTIVESLTDEFNATKLETGWIGSLAFSFTVGTCPLSTPLFTVYGARKVAFVGVIGATISLVATSFTPFLHLMFLTYSAMLGTFANFVYNTAMNLTGQYFPNKHQALATCLASAGISFGTLLINPLNQALVGAVGWRNTLRIMAGSVFVIGLSCVATFRPVKTREQKIHTKLRHHKGKKGHEMEPISEALVHAKISSIERIDIEALTESIQNMPTESRISLAAQEIKKTVFNKNVFDCSVCVNPAFILWMLGTLFWSISFLFPFIFLIDYMTTVGIPRDESAWVMTAYGIAEFVGRLICAFGAGKIRFSLAYIYAGSAAFVGTSTLLAPLGKSLGIMYAYSIAAGINSGILNSLMFVATMQFFGNEKGRHVWGYINVMLALGMVIGPVTAGGIYDITQSYVTAFYMGGGVFILCAIVMLLIPIALNHFPHHEHEAFPVREKPEPPKRQAGAQKNGSIVKPGALRKFAQQQSAMKAMNRTTKKSKWNGEVAAHLQELGEIENELKRQNGHDHPGKHVTVVLPDEDKKGEAV